MGVGDGKDDLKLRLSWMHWHGRAKLGLISWPPLPPSFVRVSYPNISEVV